jgi:hypothetical protein
MLGRKNSEELNLLQQSVWQALSEGKPHAADLKELSERGVTPLEVNHLLERWATLTLYDAFTVEPPGVKKPLELVGASEHYLVYDRGPCILLGPKNLFCHERTFADGMKTVEAASDEVFKRNWAVDLVGYYIWQRVAWVRLQCLALQNGCGVQVLGFQPAVQDHRIVKQKVMHVGEGLRLD